MKFCGVYSIRNKINKKIYSRKYSKERRENISRGLLGKKHSVETRLRRGLAIKNWWSKKRENEEKKNG